MALTNETVKQTYVGDGANTTFAIPFTYFADEDVLVYLRDETDPLNITLSLLTPGALQDYILTGATPPTTPLNINVETAVAPTVTQKIIVIRKLDLEQIIEYTNTSRFPAESHERALDRIVAMVQQLQEQLNRAMVMRMDETVTLEPFVIPLPVADTFWAWDEFAQEIKYYTIDDLAALLATGGSPGSLLEIGLPTDGAYGDPVLGDPTSLVETDVIPDALDKIVSLLALIAPAPPALLSAKILQIPSSYTAKAATTGTNDTCTDDNTPTISPNASAALTYANGFRDANAGTLTANMDAAPVGTIALTPADDTGINGDLEILGDFDPYFAMTGAGIYKALVARINSSVLGVGQHIADLTHSTTGTTSLTFSVDDPTTSVISSKVLTAPGSSSYKSGVPGVAQGQNINVAFSVDDFCGTHYNPTRIAGAQSSQTGAQVDAALGGPYVSTDTFNASINLPVAASVYSEDVSVTCKAYNSKGTLVSSAVTASVRVDTVGTESRYLSSTGQYPASGYTTAFNSTTDVLSGNKELQFINGQYKYPPSVNYSTKLPSGPDYSSLTSDAYGTMRWVTFKLSALSSATSTTITLSNVTGISSVLQSGIEMYLKVEGATGWLDMNAAYPGVGNPSANGDPALDVGGSTATSRRVTFGATPRSGDRYIRIGIPSGSTKALGGVS